MNKLLLLLALGFAFLLPNEACALQVTFSVNMQNEIVSGNGVHIAGNFFDIDDDGTPENPALYNWDPAAISLFDVDGDGIYTVDLDLTEGIYEYKYLNGNSWGTEEVPGAACRVNGNVSNRIIRIIAGQSPPVVCFGECANCGEYIARVQVDMSQLPNQGDFGVYIQASTLAGTFTDFSMYEFAPNKFWYPVPLSASEMTYTFIDGADLLHWESATNECMENGLRPLPMASADTIIPIVCFDSCAPCTPADTVLFRVNMTNEVVSPNGVFLVGMMNAWTVGDPNYQLSDDNGDMIFERLVILDDGDYEYKIVNGSSWNETPQATEQIPLMCAVNGNRFYSTSSPVDTLGFCFNQCIGDCNMWPAPQELTFKVDMQDQYSSEVNLRIGETFGTVVPMSDLDMDRVFEVTFTVSGPEVIQYFFEMPLMGSEFSFITGCDPLSNYTARSVNRTQLTSDTLFHCYATCAAECPVTYGCTDISACNYLFTADIDDGSCIPASQCTGCTNSSAINYEANNIYDDGSCLFNYAIQVFHDVNANGEMDIDESPVEGLGVECLGQVIYTDAAGQLLFSAIPDGYHDITLQLAAPWSNATTPVSFTVDPWSMQTAFVFGVNQETPTADFNISVMVEGENICDERTSFYIFIDNPGNTALNVDMYAVFDSVYTFEQTPMLETYWNDTLRVLNLGVNAFDGYSSYISMLAPSFLYMGDSAHHTLAFVVSSNGIPLDTITVNYDNVILCAYDPNDKTVYPAGYREEHFILADQELRYRIRFQNTGNAPAGRVVVRDVIDEKLDLSTFQLLHATHDYEVEINQITREVAVIFDNIELPSSEVDEPGSQGQFEYTIHTASGLQPLEVIENTAAIYFDQNPPIITNTTWNTIFHCSMMPSLAGTTMNACINQEVPLMVDTNYVESYQWFVNDVLLAQTDTLWYTATNGNENTISLDVSNPLCTASSEGLLIAHELPQAAFVFLQDHLEAIEPGLLYNWYHNGQLVQSSAISTLDVFESGEFTLEVVSQFGCTASFTNYVIVGVEEREEQLLSIYPNPASHVVRVQTGMGTDYTYQLTDALGKIVIQGKGKSALLSLDLQNCQSGLYTVVISNDQTRKVGRIVVE